ncbi:hypothetical protein ACFQYP_37375 [Nonomuraea antimicrobica]
MIIRQIRITPVAFLDPPLLNAAGVHQPWALRAIVEIVTDEGLTGLGETYGDLGHLGKVRECAQALIGLDVHALNTMYARVTAIVGEDAQRVPTASQERSIDRVFSAFEVACLDVRGKAAGVPVSDLLGGRVRTRCRTARTSSTSGPATPARNRTGSAPPWTKRASSRRPDS